MKKTSFLTINLLFYSVILTAQNAANPTATQAVTTDYVIPISKGSIKGSYPLALSDTKTVHIVFPDEIKEVDAGTTSILAEITPSFNNVLKVKSALNQSFDETNLTVLTKDGGLYSFLTLYQKNPEILNINIGFNKKSDIINETQLGIYNLPKSIFLYNNFEESTVINDAEKIQQEKPNIKNIGITNLGITALLKGIHSKNGLYYFTINLNNKTEINFNIDFIKVYIKDKEDIKKMAIQQEEIELISTYPQNINSINGNSNKKVTIVTQIFNISEEKEIEIEIYEKNGGRHLRFTIPNLLFTKTKKINI